jgi:hypothetical protein
MSRSCYHRVRRNAAVGGLAARFSHAAGLPKAPDANRNL